MLYSVVLGPMVDIAQKAHFAKAGIRTFFMVSSIGDPVNDPSMQRVYIQQDRFVYDFGDLTAAVRQCFSLIFGDNNKVDTASLIRAANVFETELSGLPAVSRNIADLFNPMTVSQLDKTTPAIDWGKLLEGTLGHTGENSKTVIVDSSRYLEDLEKLLNRTSPATM
ncbi:hypothetical protein DFQ27_007238 [Actinomortierella ambigua]|uniref:Peptidase M13 N-terminal domain-containing protein n=1 Tax=Actinomortierella ambigua TaxID=1343610 RepID=A0A9P6PVR5_9FUNG|nr:hypothetical protein DFQ27_007238 [Actinomortierella ambigua]